jgi:Flp pilus assembly protein TadG
MSYSPRPGRLCASNRAMPRRQVRMVHDDRGSATLNLVVAFPALLLLLLLTVQGALIAHARNIAQAAAQEGLRDARLYGGSQAAGQRTAEAFLTQTAGDLLTYRSVTTNRTATRARVEVQGRALSLVPGVHPVVTGHAEGPVERWAGP